MAMTLARQSVDGKATYTAVLTCVDCRAHLATHAVDVKGSFSENEAVAIGEARFGARALARADGAVFLDEERDLCAACAGKLAIMPKWQRRTLEWFASHEHTDALGGLHPGASLDIGELAKCVASGYLSMAGDGWRLTPEGRDALRAERARQG